MTEVKSSDDGSDGKKAGAIVGGVVLGVGGFVVGGPAGAALGVAAGGTIGALAGKEIVDMMSDKSDDK